ncbi:hypothetical protein C7271_01505 [filamentous cyanobacterium CCP5]|nr:hypothetical protein C7271_01505 [filamentous cyanobacterium CCP5]
MDPPNEKPTPLRVNVREALKYTIEDLGISAADLASRAKITPAALSEFRNGHRDISTRSLQSLLDSLSQEEYVYFLKLMLGAESLVSTDNASPSQSEDGSDKTSRRQAFFALAASFCSQCSQEEQVALLSVEYRAFNQNPFLVDDE